VHKSVNVSLSGGFTVRRRGNSDLGYRMEKGELQIIIQNGSGTNPASHSVGTVESFHEFKEAEERQQNKTHSAEV
jgi:hypothetical protein